MNTATVLKRMKKGEALHLEFTKRAPAWHLASGVRIQDKVARAVIRDTNVTGAGDVLFAGVPSQTWTFVYYQKQARTGGRQTNRTAEEKYAEAKACGFEVEACGECGNLTLVRAGTCMRCVECGSTSGCS